MSRNKTLFIALIFFTANLILFHNCGDQKTLESRTSLESRSSLDVDIKKSSLVEPFAMASDVLMTIRFPRKSDIVNRVGYEDTPGYSAQEAISVFDEYEADQLVWHYPFNPQNLTNRTLDEGVAPFTPREPGDPLLAMGIMNLFPPSHPSIPINCALPSFTYNPQAACKDSQSRPILFALGSDTSCTLQNGETPGSAAFVPDTSSSAFRNEVRAFLKIAREIGCTSVHQDNALMMLRGSAKQCGCRGGSANATQTQKDLENYYVWLDDLLQFSVKTANWKKSINAHEASEFLKPYFQLAISEIYDSSFAGNGTKNTPYDLSHALFFNNPGTTENPNGFPTATTLVSTNPLAHQRNIASIYALGGWPVVPWDTFIPAEVNSGKITYYYGNPDSYSLFYDFVKNHHSLFDEYSEILALNASNGPAPELSRTYKGLQVLYTSRALAVLRGKGSQRVLHVVAWDGKISQTGKDLAIRIPKSLFAKRPANATAYNLYPNTKFTISVLDSGENFYRVHLRDVRMWTVVQFN